MKLFSKNKSETILIWEIEQNGFQYRTHSGQENGTLTTSAWTTCVGKNVGRSNETTPEEQCSREVKSKIQKKKDEGYVEDVSTFGKDRFPEVMLAQEYTKFESQIPHNEAVIFDPKLDGIRCKIINGSAISRKNKKFVSVDHILEELKVLEKTGIIFDGELYNHKFKDDFNQIASLVRKVKLSEEDLELMKNLEYHVYDRINSSDTALIRKIKLQQLLQKPDGSDKFKYIKFVPYYVGTKSEVEAYWKKFTDMGYEGVIVRRDKKYEQFRSYNLLKYKKFLDNEFEIIDIEEGSGNRSGMMGRIILKIDESKTFEANALGNYDYYKELLKNKQKYIGKMATVKYQNLTPDGKPRFGRIIAIRDYE